MRDTSSGPDLEALHEKIIDQIPISDQLRTELIPPSYWDFEGRTDPYLANLFVLGRILYQLQKKKNSVEARIAWDNEWITDCDREIAPMEYASAGNIAEDNSAQVEEITATFARDADWRLIAKDLHRATRRKEDLIADLYIQYPPEKDTKRAQIESLVEAGFELRADCRALAGLCETSKRYVDSVRNKRSRETQPNQYIRESVRARDGERCVKCRTFPDPGHIHHIVPPRSGGSAEPENLALLCVDCHIDAHGGDFAKLPFYDSSEEFWEWAEMSNPYE